MEDCESNRVVEPCDRLGGAEPLLNKEPEEWLRGRATECGDPGKARPHAGAGGALLAVSRGSHDASALHPVVAGLNASNHQTVVRYPWTASARPSDPTTATGGKDSR